MQRDTEVAPKSLLRSLVMRNKGDSLERALEAKEIGIRRRKIIEERVGRVVMVGCITT